MGDRDGLPRAEHHQGNDDEPELCNQDDLRDIIIYNLWQLVNILLALELKTKLLKKPIIKLTHLGRIFRLNIKRSNEHFNGRDLLRDFRRIQDY